MSKVPVNPELSSSFCYSCSSLKKHIVLNGLSIIRIVARSENCSCQYKVDQTLFPRIALRKDAGYLPVYSNI